MSMSCARLLLAGLLTVVVVGCSSKDKPAAKDQAPAPTAEPAAAPAQPPAKPAVDEGDWDQFWPAFKKAALASDNDALRALTHIGGDISEDSFGDIFGVYLGKDMLAVIAKTDAADVKVTDGTAGAADEVRELSWSETSIVDGEEMGSALFLYFEKVDGKYRLVRLMAAG